MNLRFPFYGAEQFKLYNLTEFIQLFFINLIWMSDSEDRVLLNS